MLRLKIYQDRLKTKKLPRFRRDSSIFTKIYKQGLLECVNRS